MPWDKMKNVPDNLKKMDDVALTLDQVNWIARIADGLEKKENDVESAWAAARKQFRNTYEIKGDAWVKKEKVEGGEHQHPHGEHECKCPECGHKVSVEADVRCKEQKCSECGAQMRAVEIGERREQKTEAGEGKVIGYHFSKKFFPDLPAVRMWTQKHSAIPGWPVERAGEIFYGFQLDESAFTRGETSSVAEGVTALYAKAPEPEPAFDADGVEIFKVGRHVDGSGNAKTWTEAELDEIAANSRSDGAPIRLGHDVKSGDPAAGWVHNLRVVAGRLVGDLKRVPEAIYAKLNSSYRKRSAGLEKRDGKWTLGHLALLGAEQSAIVLKDIFSYAYSLSESGEIETENFTDGGDGLMSEKLIKKLEDENADLKGKLVAATADGEARQAEFKSAESDLETAKAELDVAKKESKEKDDKIAEYAQVAYDAEKTAWFALVEKKVEPAMKADYEALYDLKTKGDEAEFKVWKEAIEKRDDHVAFSETGAGDGTGKGDGAGDNETKDAESRDEDIRDYCKKHDLDPKIAADYATAACEVLKYELPPESRNKGTNFISDGGDSK